MKEAQDASRLRGFEVACARKYIDGIVYLNASTEPCS